MAGGGARMYLKNCKSLFQESSITGVRASPSIPQESSQIMTRFRKAPRI